jgi:hypothetical protein
VNAQKFHLGPKVAAASRYFSLPQDVANPHFDKRCKYGVRGVKSFKAGTVIHVIDYEQSVTVEGKETVHKSTEYFVADPASVGCHDVPADVAEAFSKLDPRDDKGPSTLKEAAIECGVSVETLCRYVVKSLLASGKLTIDDVLDAYETSEVDEFDG